MNLLIIFSSDLVKLKLILERFHKFLYLRGVNILTNISTLSSGFFNDKIEILSWRFFWVKKNFFVGQVSRNTIRLHKLQLKTVIKNFGNSDCFTLLNFINRVLFDWSFHYSCTDFSWDIWGELDIYLNKLLWKWARRRHPRRPNTWIYRKYWKSFFGNFKFFALDSLTSRVIFLRSHCLPNLVIYRLPLSVHNYDLLNSQKIESLFYKKFSYIFYGVFRSLWIKQRGLCFRCRKTFYFINFSNVKVSNIKCSRNYLYNLVLLHSYC